MVMSFSKGVQLPWSLELAQDLSYKLLFLLTKTRGSSKVDQSPWCWSTVLHKQKQSLFAAFANFHDINTPTKASFELPEFH